MILDKENRLSNGQVVTATALSTNVIDLHKTGMNLGAGEEIMLEVANKTLVDASGSAVVTVNLVTDDTDTISSPEVVQVLGTFLKGDAAGKKLTAYLQPAELKRYVAIQYSVATGPLQNNSTFDAYVVKDADLYKAYPIGYSIK